MDTFSALTHAPQLQPACDSVAVLCELNQATQHWHTGNTRKCAISVRPGHRVYESHVDRFRGAPAPVAERSAAVVLANCQVFNGNRGAPCQD